jgi:hypothetical protein
MKGKPRAGIEARFSGTGTLTRPPQCFCAYLRKKAALITHNRVSKVHYVFSPNR